MKEGTSMDPGPRRLALDRSGGEHLKVLLVGAFRSMVNEGSDGPFGGQGGFADTLAPAPYSLANGYLKAFVDADPLLRDRCTVELLNFSEPLYLEDEDEEVRLGEAATEAILDAGADVVGFSAYCWNIDAFLETIAELKRRRSDLRILVGGRATDGDPEGLLRAHPAIDALLLGEAEVAFRALLRRMLGVEGEALEAIPGVVYRDVQGEIRSGGPPQGVATLNELPSPFVTGTLHPPQHGVMLELSRGCLYSCGYCTWNSAKRLRLLSAERVEAEIRWALEAGHRHITVTDSAINYDTEWLRATIEAIRRADPGGCMHFTYNVRHEHITDEQLELLSKLPTHMVLLGVETLGSGGMSEVRRKQVKIEALRQTLRSVSEAVRPPVASIVLGLPGDREESFRHTLDTLMEWTEPDAGGVRAIGTVLVSLLQVYRGSLLWQRREELGLRIRERGIPYLIESPTWSMQTLARSKAHLVELMRRDPERLKAAEAIVLMEAHGGLAPWHSRRRVQKLLGEWPEGERRQGWTLERIGVQRDTARGVLLRFRFEGGGGARLFLRRRKQGERGRLRSRFYVIDRQPSGGAPPPEPALRQLEQKALELLLRGEERLVSQANEARARRAPNGSGAPHE
ncbi:MAG: radical SAM protein [Myxococcales bacterium]|nr:radical SAM protein [Myxococcales bacterium]